MVAKKLFKNNLSVLLIPFLASFVFTTLLLYVFLLAEDKVDYVKRSQEAKTITALAERTINQYANKYISEILFLGKVGAENLGKDNELIEKVFRDFLVTQNDIDQIRFLNLDGQEVIRFNNIGGKAVEVHKNNLQNKKNRDYFYVPLQSKKDVVFISALDLNIEHNKVEIPVKPVIRFSVGVYDNKGKKKGVFVVNVKAKEILERIKATSSNAKIELFLAGKNNDWLISPPTQIAWSSYLGISNSNAESYDPVLSKALQDNDAQFRTVSSGNHTFFVKKLVYTPSKFYKYVSSKETNMRLVLEATRQPSWVVTPQTLKDNMNTVFMIYLLGLFIAIIVTLHTLRRRELEYKNRIQEEISYKFLFDAPQAVMIFDEQGEVYFQNEQMTKIIEEMDGSEISEIATPENRKMLWNRPAIEVMEGDCKLRSSDGVMHYFKRQAFTISTDKASKDLIGIIMNDYTDIENANIALKDSAKQISTILDAAPDAIIVSDADGAILMTNQKAQTLFDISQQDFLNTCIDDLVPMPQKTNHRHLRDTFFKSPKHRLMTEKPNIYAQSSKGRIFNVEISLSPIQQNGRINAISIIRDVSDRKKMESQLRQSQKMEALGQLTGGIAHDFNNLLTSIIGNIDLSIDFLSQEKYDKKEVSERLTVAVNGALKAAKLTKKLLSFSRDEAHNSSLVNIGQQIQDEFGLIDSACGKLIRIELVVKDDIKPVDIDQEELTNALINLATNARDAMPEGGIIFIKVENYDIDEENVEVFGSEIPKGHYVALTFSDKGTGIEPDKLEKIFEPFYTTKPKYEGTGLGLSMVFGFVKQSGGFIKVYSEFGIGTTFKLFFPVEAQEEVTAEEVAQLAAIDQYLEDTESQHQQSIPEVVDKPALDNQDLIKASILLVDDEAELLNLASRYLESAGHTVYNATNSKEAMSILEVKQVDLVLSDIVMPDKNGFELEKDIHEKYKDMPVIFSSGFPEEALKRESRFRKELVLIDKPYRKKDLVDTVAKFLQKMKRAKG